LPCTIQDAQRAGDFEPFGAGDDSAILVIHQHHVRVECECKGDGVLLAGIETG
jgi:hypothetical protein